MIILSNIDGLYDGEPGNPGAKLIGKVGKGDDIKRFICTSHSSAGRRRMETKCKTATAIAAKGIKVIIANRKRENIISKLIESATDAPHTEFSIN